MLHTENELGEKEQVNIVCVRRGGTGLTRRGHCFGGQKGQK